MDFKKKGMMKLQTSLGNQFTFLMTQLHECVPVGKEVEKQRINENFTQT